MVEMIRDLIMGILGLIRKGDLEKASVEIDRLFNDFLKEDSSFFTSIPAEKLSQKLLKEHNYTHGHLEILAWLFDTEAELELARGNNKMSLEFSQKSLLIFEFIENEQKTYSFEKTAKINTIKKRIESLTGKKSEELLSPGLL
jgi:hypothetical protein